MSKKPVKSDAQAVTKEDYLSLAGLLEGERAFNGFIRKSLTAKRCAQAGAMYENREYVSAYECFKPVYDKVVSDMQRDPGAQFGI